MTSTLAPNNGFDSPEALAKARALLLLAQGSERARASLSGLDALCEAIDLPLLIEPRGVVFSPCPEAEFDQGLAGFLGKYLMRVAQSAPARPAPAPVEPAAPAAPAAPTPIQHASRLDAPLASTATSTPSPAQPAPTAEPRSPLAPLVVATVPPPAAIPPAPLAHAPMSAPAAAPGAASAAQRAHPPTNPPATSQGVDEAPAPLKAPAALAQAMAPRAPSPFAQATAGSNADLLDDDTFFEGDDFDPDSEEFFDEPTSATAQGAHSTGSQAVPEPAWERPPEAPPAPPMTMAQIKAMMGTGASLAAAQDPLSDALARLAASSGAAAGSRAAFAKKSSWDAWGGQAKRAARAAASRSGMRHEHDPQGSAPDAGALATFCIDPGPLPLLGSEAAAADQDLERLVLERLRAALDSADQRAKLYGASALLLCGWGARQPIAEAEARARGWSVERLD